MKENKIPFMDLQEQTNRLMPEVIEAITNVCRATAFTDGTFVTRFEQDFAAFLGAPRFTGVSSGSDALFLALKALGIGPGDEVIIPANTYIATAFAVTRVGAVPVFADCSEETWEIDPVSAEKKITAKTRALIGVHLYGQAFPVDEMRRLAGQYGLKLLEDCAQSQGTLYHGEMAGTLSDAGCFSFYPSKNLGAFGQAGGVAAGNDELDRSIRILRSQGENGKYHHVTTGYNMRLDAIQAAVLSVKLPHLPAWNEKRGKIIRRYREEIHNLHLRFQAELPETKPAWYLAVACVEKRQHFLAYMEEKNINCGIHYPVPCHLQGAMVEYGYRPGDLPCAEHQAAHCVSLPLFPELPEEAVDRVIDACNAYHN